MSNLKMLVLHKDTNFNTEAAIPTKSASLVKPYGLLYIMQTPPDFPQANVRCFCWTAPMV